VPGFPSNNLLRDFAPLMPVTGCASILAHQAGDLFAFWQAWEAERGAPCGPPFWAVAWPAARVLAGYLLAHPETVGGRAVIDLGCGGAVAGIAAAMAGAAAVIANDVDPVAVHIAALNARASGVEVTPTAGDLTASAPRGPARVVLVADMFYEKGPSGGMMDWLRAAAAAGWRVVIADGGRPFSPIDGLVDLHVERVAVDVGVEGVPERVVRIRELGLRPAGG
jgi:predicted nicotinamide N-methyase